MLSSCREAPLPLTPNEITLKEAERFGIEIVIPDSSLQSIVEIRERALKRNLLIEKDKYEKVLLICGRDTLKGKLRLKGDHIDHLKGNRWSYRVKLKKSTLLGERKFSIQGVRTRFYLNEWIYHELLKSQGLIGLQYEFIPVSVCDIDSLAGIYAFESHFKSEMLNIQGKEVGAILKFNESKLWGKKLYRGDSNRDSLIMLESEIQITNKKDVQKSSRDSIIRLIDNYRNGNLKVGDVFDLKKWSTFFVINGIMASKHSMRWHNLRFYFNPNSKLFEPVGFDMGSWQADKGAWFLKPNEMEAFYEAFYESEIFKAYLVSETKRLASTEFIEQFFSERENQIDEKIELLQNEKSNYKFGSESFYAIKDSILIDLRLVMNSNFVN